MCEQDAVIVPFNVSTIITQSVLGGALTFEYAIDAKTEITSYPYFWNEEICGNIALELNPANNNSNATVSSGDFLSHTYVFNSTPNNRTIMINPTLNEQVGTYDVNMTFYLEEYSAVKITVF